MGTGKTGFVRGFLTEFLNWIRSGLESGILPAIGVRRTFIADAGRTGSILRDQIWLISPATLCATRFAHPGREVYMQNKNHTTTSSTEGLPPQPSFSSQPLFPRALYPSDQTQTEGSSLRTVGLEFIDSRELARRWGVPVSWVRDQVRGRAEDPLPHVNLGKYVRFLWGSDGLELWIRRRIVMGNNRRLGRTR